MKMIALIPNLINEGKWVERGWRWGAELKLSEWFGRTREYTSALFDWPGLGAKRRHQITSIINKVTKTDSHEVKRSWKRRNVQTERESRGQQLRFNQVKDKVVSEIFPSRSQTLTAWSYAQTAAYSDWELATYRAQSSFRSQNFLERGKLIFYYKL